MKKTLAILILIVPAAGFGYHSWRNSTAERPRFRTLTVSRGDLLIGVTATGTVEPIQYLDVSARIGGPIKSFGPDLHRPGKTIDYCSQVNEGDVLFRLDDVPGKVDLDRATAGVKQAESEVLQSRARLNQTERAFQRAERLRRTNSEADFEVATSAYEGARAELAVSEARLDQAKINKRQSEINLDYTIVRSPFKATVIARRANLGQTIAPGQGIFLLATDLSRMHVWAAVNEADIADIHIGQSVTFKVDAYRDQTFHGAVSQIRQDASVVASVVTYGVVADVDNSEGKLMPYMTAKLQFEVARRTNVLLVPGQALRWKPTWDQITPSARAGLTAPAPRTPKSTEEKNDEYDAPEPTVDNGLPIAWVRAGDGLVRPVPVTLGLTDSILTEVIGGDLQAKDEVVINSVRAAKPDFVSSFINKVVKQ